MSHQSHLTRHLLPPIVMLFILACACPFRSLGSSDLRKGIEAYEACDPMTAKDFLDTVLENDEKDAEAYYYRGLVNYTIGNFQEAIEDLTVVINLESDNPEAFFY